MGVNPVPEKIANFNVYKENNVLVGVSGEITMPNLEAMTETISGAGIAGEYESPTPGHFGSMELEIPFRTVHDTSFSLYKEIGKSIILRAAQQSYDVAGGEYRTRPLKVTLRGHPKNLNLGTMAVGQPTETTPTIELIYIKVEEDGKELLEVDKLNMIFRVQGEDMFAELREQI